MKLEFTKKELANALNEAYKEAGNNAYFGNGFKAGVDFVLTELAKHTQALQLLQPDVSGQSGQFYCFNDRHKFPDSTIRCITQCEFCRPKNI